MRYENDSIHRFIAAAVGCVQHGIAARRSRAAAAVQDGGGACVLRLVRELDCARDQGLHE